MLIVAIKVASSLLIKRCMLLFNHEQKSQENVTGEMSIAQKALLMDCRGTVKVAIAMQDNENVKQMESSMIT